MPRGHLAYLPHHDRRSWGRRITPGGHVSGLKQQPFRSVVLPHASVKECKVKEDENKMAWEHIPSIRPLMQPSTYLVDRRWLEAVPSAGGLS